MRLISLSSALCISFATAANAHTSSQALVMLLPTDIYIGAGVLAIALTVALLAVPAFNKNLSRFPHRAIFTPFSSYAANLTSLSSLALLAIIVYAGISGSRDPLLNPLPLLVWTVWWVGIVILHGVLGNLWHWINPWTGLFNLLGAGRDKPTFILPKRLGTFPAIVGFLCFSFFMLAHTAPEDPAILAFIVSIYWSVTFTGMLLFGARDWLERCDFVTVLLRQFSHVSVFGLHAGKLHIGIPGWKLQYQDTPGYGLAILTLLLLGTSSFDGFNETFMWLVMLGINPLEFPGRSAIVGQTISGILIGNALLLAVFALCVCTGLALAKSKVATGVVFRKMSLTILPIAVGYHFAHYLSYFLVNIQYTVAATSDPFSNGSDLLGLGTFYVTTGFFNTRDTVELIFLSQAFAVVAGHMVSIFAAHIAMTGVLREGGRIVVSQIPMALFMIAYTFFGLWLLAAPRGA